jgi:hypothetical protein
VDLLRSCYTTDMYSRLGVRFPATWYFVPRGTPWVPLTGAFGSTNWDAEFPPNVAYGYPSAPGEIMGSPRPWRNGSRPAFAPPFPGPVQGTPDQWEHGCGDSLPWGGTGMGGRLTVGGLLPLRGGTGVGGLNALPWSLFGGTGVGGLYAGFRSEGGTGVGGEIGFGCKTYSITTGDGSVEAAHPFPGQQANGWVGRGNTFYEIGTTHDRWHLEIWCHPPDVTLDLPFLFQFIDGYWQPMTYTLEQISDFPPRACIDFAPGLVRMDSFSLFNLGPDVFWLWDPGGCHGEP